MAELIIPTKCYRIKPKGKFHLTKHGVLAVNNEDTVCGFILWDERFETKNISDVSANDLCKRCLGPLEAK